MYQGDNRHMNTMVKKSLLFGLVLLVSACAGFGGKEEYTRLQMISWLPEGSEIYLAAENPGESALIRSILESDSRFAGIGSVIDNTDSLYLGLDISEDGDDMNAVVSGDYPDSLYSLFFSASHEWEKISNKPLIYRNPDGFSVSANRYMMLASAADMDEILYRKEAGSSSPLAGFLSQIEDSPEGIDLFVNTPDTLVERFLPGAGILFPLKAAWFQVDEVEGGVVLNGYLAPEDSERSGALARVLHLFRSGVMILIRDETQKQNMKQILFEDAGDRVLIEGLFLDTETMLSYL